MHRRRIVGVYVHNTLSLKLKRTPTDECCGGGGPFPDAAQVENVVALLAAPHGVSVPDSVTTHHATVAPAGELFRQLTGLETGRRYLLV